MLQNFLHFHGETRYLAMLSLRYLTYSNLYVYNIYIDMYVYSMNYGKYEEQ